MTQTSSHILEALALLAEGRDLSQDLAKRAMDELMSGQCTPSQVGALLMGLRAKGETVDEITAFAQTMRAHSVGISPAVDAVIDVVGTGGAKLKTFNISTTTAFIVAGAGMPVAKHGNRSNSSPSGSADVLEALGVNLSVSAQRVQKSVETIGIGFLFAPTHHPAMKHAIGPRKELGMRTVFNMLGPLTNPARASHYLMGVYAPELVATYPYVLRNLGARRALVVYGVDGVDECSTLGETLVGELNENGVKQYRIRPEQFGFKQTSIDKVKNVPPAESAVQTRGILNDNIRDERLEIVLLNAGAALYAAGKADSIETGIEKAQESIKSGAANEKLEALIEFTNQPEPSA